MDDSSYYETCGTMEFKRYFELVLSQEDSMRMKVVREGDCVCIKEQPDCSELDWLQKGRWYKYRQMYGEVGNINCYDLYLDADNFRTCSATEFARYFEVSDDQNIS